jgi:hypothetical protein
MLELISHLYNVARVYAQIISIPLFSLITLIWAWRHQQWRPNITMKFAERMVLKLVTLAVGLTPTANLVLGQWAQAALLSVPLLYVIWIGVRGGQKYASILGILIVTFLLGVIGWFTHSPITSILLLIITVGAWEVWLGFLTQVSAVQMGWLAFLSTTAVHILGKIRGIPTENVEHYRSVEARRQQLMPVLFRESVQLLPAMFLIVFMILYL